MEVSSFCISHGVIPPTISPASAEYLSSYLERVEHSLLSDDEAEYMEKLKSKLLGDMVFDDGTLSIDIDLDMNLYLAFGDFDALDYSNFPDAIPSKDRRGESFSYRDTDPFANLRAEMFFGDNVALEGTLLVGNNSHHIYKTSLGWLYAEYDGKEYSVFSVKEGDITSYPLDFPYLSGLSIGNGFSSLIVGRYAHSVGLGKTGNLVAADNFKYQEIVQGSLFSNKLSYYATVTRFDQMLEKNNGFYEFSRSEFMGNQQYRVHHRIEISPFDNLRASIDLGTLYNTSSGMDIRFFQPLMLQHNYGNYSNKTQKEYYDEANNIMSFSIDYLPIDRLLISSEFVLDQYQTPSEEKESVPPAFGARLSVLYSNVYDGSIIDGFFETVYTNPYLYLNGKADANGKLDHNLDYIVGYHSEYGDDYGYSGYQFGPDTILFAMGFNNRSFETGWSFSLEVLYRIQGMNIVRHRAEGHHSMDIDMANACFYENPDIDLKTPSGGFGLAEHLLEAKCGAEFEYKGLAIYVEGLINIYWNYENNPDLDCVLAPIVRFGTRYAFF